MQFEDEVEIVERQKRPLHSEILPPSTNPPTGYHWYGDLPDTLPNGRVTQAVRSPRPQSPNEKGIAGPSCQLSLGC